jgi:mRNA interferase MazF
MTDYNFGDVVLVSFPFTNLQTTKKRPAVIVSNKMYNTDRPDVILMAISSNVREPLYTGEALVTNWQHAGLIKASVFKPLIATIEQHMIIKKMGELSNKDRKSLLQILNNILSDPRVL